MLISIILIYVLSTTVQESFIKNSANTITHNRDKPNQDTWTIIILVNWNTRGIAYRHKISKRYLSQILYELEKRLAFMEFPMDIELMLPLCYHFTSSLQSIVKSITNSLSLA
jgi:hypothetical protein